MRRFVHFALFVVVLLANTLAPLTADQVLIPAGAAWRYNDSGTNLGTAWRATAYSDSAWATGNAELGYGDGGEATVISYGTSTTARRITYYFRKAFAVADPALVSGLVLRYVRDDGAVIYLNGTEVVRSNMPAGTIGYTTLATTAISGADEAAWQQTQIDPALLVAGTNVIAVELHQQSASSSDVSFNLELVASEAQPAPPTSTLLTPYTGSSVNTSAVTFTADVTAAAGLSEATLFVGAPPQTVAFSGPSQVEDAQIVADTPTVTGGDGQSINVDGQGPHAHGLLRFPTLIGSAAGQVPAGALITSAVLQLSCTNAGNVMRVYPLTQNWNENEATWNQRSNGVAWGAPGADGAASNTGAYVNANCTATGLRSVDLTSIVQGWSAGAANFGLVFVDTGTDGIDFWSSESASSPLLTVTFRGAQTPLQTQALAGTSSSVAFQTSLPLGQSVSWNVRVTDALGRQAWASNDFTLALDAAAPNAPALVAPAMDATGVSATPALSAFVGNPDGGPLTVRASIRKAVADEFTIVVLPDTQHYSEAYPAVFTSQTQWIAANRTSRNIVFVTHEGDIVENFGNTTEWVRADTSMKVLEAAGIPFGVGPGNHDQPTTLYNQYFGVSRFQGRSYYGGHYLDNNDNNFELFSGGGMDFVIVHLAFCPPTAAVAWASSVLQTYPERIGIMTTHGYLNESAQRTVHGCSSTQYLWDQLAVPNPNLRFMLSGHVHDESRRTDTVGNRTVFQMLADYQDRSNGGDGWLRILRFVPAEDKVHVETYSPWLNQYETDANSAFTLDFPMGGAFEDAGSVVVPNNSQATITSPALEPFTRYEWRMTVTNASGRVTLGPTWAFTTGGGGAPNQQPTATPQTLSGIEDSPTAVTLTGNDPEGAPLSYVVLSPPTKGTLTGVAPALTYIPAANANGTDSFTFRVNDGQTDSAPATVIIAVQAVNDVPTAAADTYTVSSGTTLTVNAKGVLANDADVEGSSLTAVLVAPPGKGSLVLNPDGSFVYVSNAGAAGTDSFTYAAHDGSGASSPATVTLTITSTPPASTTIFNVGFTSGADSFVYADNRFRGATQSSYASGSRVTSGGFSGGALRVLLGGINNTAVTGMSGGWARSFSLASAATVTLTLRYNLSIGTEYESDEFSQVLVSLDGALKGLNGTDYVRQLVGAGGTSSTGWVQVTIALGVVPAGNHTLAIGGYNNKKTTIAEQTTILIDDVTLTATP